MNTLAAACTEQATTWPDAAAVAGVMVPVCLGVAWVWTTYIKNGRG